MGDLLHEEKAFAIIGWCMAVHKTLGAGFLEAAHQEALALELAEANIPFEREKAIAINYRGRILDKRHFADFPCYGEIIVESKAVATLLPEHHAQVLNYLKATGKRVGPLVNFRGPSLQWKRVVS